MASDSQDQLQSPVLLKINFMKDNPLDSDVVNETTGELLFRISTLSKLLSQKSKTTMYDAHEQVVAEYECGWVHSKVTFRGKTKDVAEWLPKVGFWTRSRTWTAPHGKEYVWKNRRSTVGFKLIDPTTKIDVAKTHTATAGIFHEKRNMGIDILSPELVPFLDGVVLSFVVCEKERRDSQRVASTTAATAGVTAATTAAVV
ncbi:hypothetical protein C8Q76DRAFT_696883 [Earliella scabrosa]|nr:hypothetical protein C8Q76DRAFT_696883 [Earliella scabrosa]